jgi:hypothetical protein
MPVAVIEKKVSRVDEFRKLIEGNGDKVLASDCTKWLSEHHCSCAGCPSDLGCTKLLQMLRLQLPNNLPEERINDLMKGILNARTTKEATEIYRP